ncbi:glycoside hydrolase family 3 C-terminal domain-containing protein [Consotaella sp. CSK11QG-6]
MKPATCFPNGSAFACSWDVDLAYELGTALARECRAMNVHLLLGPGINIRRTPLGGRSYEYYSEDPVVSGELAGSVITGLQDHGVGASLKHFACNNSEVERTTMDSVVEERALREIYLAGFRRAIEKGRPWTVMSSYNRLNGVQAAENRWLLQRVLRDEWGYDGLVVSDWHGIKDRPASLLAGNDLDMPESSTRKRDLLAAIREGAVPAETVKRVCERVLAMVFRAKEHEQCAAEWDAESHHTTARRMAAESIVLLKNDGILPLDMGKMRRIAVVGRAAIEPVIQGSGCATTTPTAVDGPLEEIRKVAGSGVTVDYVAAASDPELLSSEEATICARADGVIVFANTEVGYDGEGSDRSHLNLAPGQDALIGRISALNRRVVVVLANPDAIVMPWLDEVGAVLETFFAGQGMGAAVADILCGRTVPSGKLTTTFPARIEDIPGYPDYPGENGRHVYSEGIYVGYRYYDKRGIEPLFPFGFGLSYTSFAYADLTLSHSRIAPGEGLDISFSLTNVGGRAGKEIYQIYIEHGAPRLHRAPRDLRAFAKVALEPGETKRVTLRLNSRDFEVYDPTRGAWVLDDDTVHICVGASSRDIRLSAPVETMAPNKRYRRLARDTQPVFILDNPIARPVFVRFVREQSGLSDTDAERILEHCRGSFFGIFTTLDRRLRMTFSPSAVEAVIAEANRAMDEAETEHA